MSAAVVKVALEHNAERREVSGYQHEMRDLYEALSDGKELPDSIKDKSEDDDSVSDGISTTTPQVISGHAWEGGDSPKPKSGPSEKQDDSIEVFKYVYMGVDEEENDEVKEELIKVNKKDIPTNAEIDHKAKFFGKNGSELEIMGVKVPWFLWTRLQSSQAKMYIFYNSDLIQFFTAGLIFGNFIVNAAEAQVRENEGAKPFKALEMFFTCIFTFELAINFYAHKYGHFINSWNIFDSVVVLVSLLSLALDNLPGISTLRLMRAFRVFRLFKRLASLRKIMAALSNSVPGCSNAFAIVILVTSIYSILGVQFFKEVGEGDMKGRYFGTFLRAMLTMFQVMTGDSWAEGVSRPTMEHYPDNGQRVLVQLFFVSYILLVGIVLTNVVVAVLLEKMTMDDDIEEVPEETQLKGNTDNQFKELVTALTKRLKLQDEETKRIRDDLSSLKSHILRAAAS